MKHVDIIFGPYAPDYGGMPRADLPGYLVDAVGVRHTPNGYRGAPQLQSVASSVAFTGSGTVARGMIAPRANGEAKFLIIAEIIASNPRLYVSTDYGQNWQIAIALSGTQAWAYEFAPYDHRIFLPCGDSPFVYDIDAHSVSAPAGVPIGSTGARVLDHMVLGAFYHATDYRTEKAAVQWSAIGDPEDWPTPGSAAARSKQAGKQYLPRNYGWVGKVIGGEKFGLIFQERAITRMTYVGSSAVFEFDTFETTEGCGELDTLSGQVTSQPAIVPLGPGRWVWANDHGVFITDGHSVRNVSDGIIDEALFANTISFPDSIGGRARSAAYDQLRGLVVFKTGSTSQLTYDVKSGNFGFLESSNFNAVFSGKTSLTNGKIQAYNVTTGRQIQRLDGPNDGIALQTGYIELVPNHRVQLHGAHLLGTGVPGSLTLSYKAASDYDDLNTLQTGFTNLASKNTRTLQHNARADARFFSFRVTGTGAESQLIRGIRVFYDGATAA